MNTTDLPPLIRECVDGAANPISFGEIRARAALRDGAVRRAPARRQVRLGAAAGLAAAGIAGALVAGQVAGGTGGTGGTSAGSRTVLTAAMVRHLASASRAAMTSGQAQIVWTSSGSSAPFIQDITFGGADWRDVMDPGVPTHQVRLGPQATGWAGTSISEVVDGRSYRYPAVVPTPQGPQRRQEWEYFDVPGAARPVIIPDPRTLLSVLSPAAGFVPDGYITVNGVRLEHLRATTPGAVPAAPLDPVIGSEPVNAQLSALDVWVDPSGVVLKVLVTVTGGPGTVQELTPAGLQAVDQYIKDNNITIASGILQNPQVLSAWVTGQAGSRYPGLASLVQQPGMTTTRQIAPNSVTVTLTFSQVGQPQQITAPAHYITAGHG
jgi:hypothetical protein